MNITVGRVSNRVTAKVHYNINGLAYCGSGSGRILSKTVRSLRTHHNLCKTCARRVRQLLDTFLSMAATGHRARQYAVKLREVFRSAQEIAAESAMLRDMAERLAKRWEQPRELTWAEQKTHRERMLAPVGANEDGLW